MFESRGCGGKRAEDERGEQLGDVERSSPVEFGSAELHSASSRLSRAKRSPVSPSRPQPRAAAVVVPLLTHCHVGETLRSKLWNHRTVAWSHNCQLSSTVMHLFAQHITPYTTTSCPDIVFLIEHLFHYSPEYSPNYSFDNLPDDLPNNLPDYFPTSSPESFPDYSSSYSYDYSADSQPTLLPKYSSGRSSDYSSTYSSNYPPT
ncbi:hypothetical protein ANO11243_072760 [Dothideomycetidae sp. 11243]|nr:hypothetical protein ANO11243_072760 [fungal sp. No.11243]